ncbi:MAG: biotin/lipoyl-containing protein, partial [Thermodesulfobacteriota bacterium]
VNNVLFDTEEERYKMVTAQVKDLCYGLYGKTPTGVDPEVQKKALKGYERGEKPITCRPAEVLEPELEKAKEEIGDLAVDDDDLLVYTLFPVTGKKFLKRKYGLEEVPKECLPTTLEDAKKEEELVRKARAGKLVESRDTSEMPEKSEYLRKFNVFVEDECFEVGVDEIGGAPVIAYAQPQQQAAPQPQAQTQPRPKQQAGTKVPPPPPAPGREKSAAPEQKKAEPAAKEPSKAAEPAPAKAAAAGDGTPVKAPMPGIVIKYEKNVGDEVNEGDTVVVIEAMKMENSLPAPKSGRIKSVNCASGDSVAKEDVLAVIE